MLNCLEHFIFVIGVVQLQPRVFGTVFHLILDFLSHYLLLKRI